MATITHPLTPRKKIKADEIASKAAAKELRLTLDGDPRDETDEEAAVAAKTDKVEAQQQSLRLTLDADPRDNNDEAEEAILAEATAALPSKTISPEVEKHPGALDARSRRRTMSEWPADEEGEELTTENNAQFSRRSQDNFCQANEIHEPEWSMCPFPSSIVASFSCHGVEPSHFVIGAKAKINQDRGCVVHPYGGDVLNAMFAVYDGHGKDGDRVSQFAMTHFRDNLHTHALYQSDLSKAMVETMLATNTALEASEVPDLQSGTTAVVALLRDKTVYLANVGDSRAVVARRNPESGGLTAVDLTIDQNPDMPEEKARIEAAGGYVKPSPEVGFSARVYLDPEFTSCGLAMGRSVGDRCVKSVGVIAEPVISSLEISEVDEFMIMASDGIWEFISSDEAVAVVAPLLKEHGAKEACKQLIVEAAQRWKSEEEDYRDDITAIVVRLNPLTLTPDLTHWYLTLDGAADRHSPLHAKNAEITTSKRNGLVMLDTNGNGQIDTVAVDTTGDSQADTFYDALPVDTTKDGHFDAIQIDVTKGRRSRNSFDADPSDERSGTQSQSPTTATPGTLKIVSPDLPSSNKDPA